LTHRGVVMDNPWQIKGKKKEKEKRSVDTPGAGKITFESPWAITKKVKKDVDIVDTIMKNRAKAAGTLGVGAEIIGQKKKRKSLKAPEEDTQTGKVQKKKQMPADDEQDSAPVAKKAKMSAAAKFEPSKGSMRSQIAGVPSAATHLEV
jgi:esterase/lipase superfamily enzyme